MKVGRRNFMQKALVGLSAIIVGLFPRKSKGKDTSTKEISKKVESATESMLDDYNRHLSSVYTHLMSLHGRMHRIEDQITESIVREASYTVTALMDSYLKDFCITKCEIFQKHGQVEYTATFLILGTNRVLVRNYKSSFMFLILGKSGDPIWISGTEYKCFHEDWGGSRIVTVRQ